MNIDDLPNQYQYCEQCGDLISSNTIQFFCDRCHNKEELLK